MREQQIDAADDRRVDCPLADRFRREMERHHRRRACRVDGDAGAAEIHGIGDAVGHDAERVARHHVHIGHRRIGEEARRVVDGRCTDIDAGLAPRQARWTDASVGERIVRDFEEMAMLGIDLLGLARTHAEGGGIEAPDVVDYAGCESVAAAGLVGGGMIEGGRGKPLGIDPRHSAMVVAQNLPQLIAVARSGRATRIADNGYFAFYLHTPRLFPNSGDAPISRSHRNSSRTSVPQDASRALLHRPYNPSWPGCLHTDFMALWY